MITDIMIYESGDGGDWNLKSDDLETIGGLTNQVYLALFGGNIEQNTDENLSDIDERYDYWANEFIEDEYRYNSSFERMIINVALNSSGISKLVNAAKNDLKYLEAYADIEVIGSITDVGKFTLDVKLDEPDGLSTKVKFIWDATKNEVIEKRII